MHCSKCGTNLNEGEKYCRGCGNQIIISNLNSSLYDKENVNNNIQNNNYTLEENNMLIKAYLGKENWINTQQMYKKITKNKKFRFSFGTFFWGPLYFVYRKLYIVGILSFIIKIFLEITNNSIWADIFIFLLSCIFYPLYIKNMNNNINNIKNENPNDNIEQLKQKCYKKGGVLCQDNIIGMIISIVLLLILSFGFGLIFSTNKKYETSDYVISYNSKKWTYSKLSNEMCGSSSFIYQANDSKISILCNSYNNSLSNTSYSLKNSKNRENLVAAFYIFIRSKYEDLNIIDATELKKVQNKDMYVMYFDYEKTDEYGRMYILCEEKNEEIKMLGFSAVTNDDSIKENFYKESLELINKIEIK